MAVYDGFSGLGKRYWLREGILCVSGRTLRVG
jgi:hypothetical protein